jgi:hypothetical protein
MFARLKFLKISVAVNIVLHLPIREHSKKCNLKLGHYLLIKRKEIFKCQTGILPNFVRRNNNASYVFTVGIILKDDVFHSRINDKLISLFTILYMYLNTLKLLNIAVFVYPSSCT